jgi:GPI mannosyltransferase 3
MLKKYIFIALLFHLLAAWFSIGRYHADEQFQILEFTGYKLGINTAQELPWEFHEKMRSSTQVFFTYCVIKALPFIQNPFIRAFILRLISSLLGFFALYQLTKTFKHYFSEKQFNWLMLLTCTYCFIPYFHARFSSENISSSLLILGLVIILNLKKNSYLLWAGILFGLAYTVRMQTLFMLFGLGFWLLFIYKSKWQQIALLTFGFGIAVFIGLVCDRWFYGIWTNTTWNYVYQNIILHKVEDFGVQPFWYYFEKIILDGIPPFSIIIILSFFILFYLQPKHILTWLFVPFLLIHFFISHKELRFLFPLINFVPLVFILALKEIQAHTIFSKLNGLITKYKGFYLKPLFLITNTLLLFYLCFKPADNYTPVLKALYNQYDGLYTNLYYYEHNPYDNAIALNFYKSKFIKTLKLEPSRFDNINYKTQKTLLLIEDEEQLKTSLNAGLKLELIYSSIPDFLHHFNFNHWIERTGQIKIYEVII